MESAKARRKDGFEAACGLLPWVLMHCSTSSIRGGHCGLYHTRYRLDGQKCIQRDKPLIARWLIQVDAIHKLPARGDLHVVLLS